MRIEDVKQEVDRRVERGEFIAVQQEPGTLVVHDARDDELERETIDRMHAAQDNIPSS